MPPKKSAPAAKKKAAPAPPPKASGMSFTTTLTFVLFAAMMASYSARVHSPEEFKAFTEKYAFLKPLEAFYQFVDDYSPFHEFINDLPAPGGKKATPKKEASEPKQPPKGPVLMTKEELAQYDGGPDSKGVYLAVLGQVFDVSKGKEHYGPGGGYGFFSGRDGSRAFVSGEFNEAGLVDDVSGLSSQDYIGLQEWVEFYHKDYTYVGKLVGNFYDADGKETQANREFQASLLEAKQDSDKKNAERKMFPQCNTEWSKKKGHRVWCTSKTGGEERGWVGRPREGRTGTQLGKNKHTFCR